MIIICGPSYGGKSRFISEDGAGIISLPEDAEIEFLSLFLKNEKLNIPKTVLHFNISLKSENRKTNKHIFSKLKECKAQSELNVIFLITPVTELKERIFMGSMNDTRHNNPVEEIRTIMEENTDHAQIYLDWINAFEQQGYEVEYIKSSKNSFKKIEKIEVEPTLRAQVTTTNTQYSYDEIKQKLTETEPLVYHRVELPYGLFLKGQNIWKRFPYIFSENISNQTLLDIGCAYGGFSFEAERRGAIVTACDINKERLSGALMMKELINSRVNFVNADYLFDNKYADRKFDIVMALNVLHHVPNVETALERLANLARKYVILEFPTSADLLYNAKQPMKNVVGPILIEKSSLFKDIKIIPSSKEGRVFAICSKRGNYSAIARKNKIGIPRHEHSIAA